MNSDNVKPVEFYPIERMTIKIGEEKVIWRKLTIEIVSRLGEHTVAKLRYLAPPSHEKIYDAAIENEGDTEVLITGRNNIREYITNSDGEQEQIDNSRILLQGVIEELEVLRTRANAIMVEMKCVSRSILLDRIPRYRSFQDPSISYSDIAGEVNRNYRTGGEEGQSDLVVVGDGLDKVPRMSIQYDETDWEYLKRVASYVGEPVMPYTDKVLMGFLRERGEQTPNITYSMYGKRKERKRRGFKINGSEIYTVSTPVKLKTRDRSGETVENDYFVLESRIYNEGNMLRCEYVLGKQNDYFVDPIPNERIKGAVIEGRVRHIARTDERKSEHGRGEGSSSNLEEKSMGAKPVNLYVGELEERGDRSEEIRSSDIAVMTVDLTEGLFKLGGKNQGEADRYAGKSYFPYVTPYSQTNTGFTPAPEVNDRVALYFPSGNESHGIVIGAVNNDGNGRFTNPDKRNFTLGPSQASKGGTPANEGKPMYNFTLDSERFIVEVGSIIQMVSKGDIAFESNKNFTQTAATGEMKLSASANKIDIVANKSLNGVAQTENVHLEAKKRMEIIAEDELIGESKNALVMNSTSGTASISGKETAVGLSGESSSATTVVAGKILEMN